MSCLSLSLHMADKAVCRTGGCRGLPRTCQAAPSLTHHRAERIWIPAGGRRRRGQACGERPQVQHDVPWRQGAGPGLRGSPRRCRCGERPELGQHAQGAAPCSLCALCAEAWPLLWSERSVILWCLLSGVQLRYSHTHTLFGCHKSVVECVLLSNKVRASGQLKTNVSSLFALDLPAVSGSMIMRRPPWQAYARARRWEQASGCGRAWRSMRRRWQRRSLQPVATRTTVRCCTSPSAAVPCCR